MDPSFRESLPDTRDEFFDSLPESGEYELVQVVRRFFERVKYASGDFGISAAAAKALEELNG